MLQTCLKWLWVDLKIINCLELKIFSLGAFNFIAIFLVGTSSLTKSTYIG